MTDKEILERLCAMLNGITKKFGVTLAVVEIKGTIYFFPQLSSSD